jgi:hypothetical protein
MKITKWNRIFTHQSTVPAVKKVEFVSDSMSYIVLRSRWCNIIVLNVHVATEEKNNNSKDSFYEELEHMFNHSVPSSLLSKRVQIKV